MATRLESGQMQLRGAGGVPMQQVTVPQVDRVAPRVEANANAQLAAALDRMAAQVTNDALYVRQQEGLQFAAQNPLTVEQIEAAKQGKIEPLNLSNNPLSAFGQAVRKARSLELAGHFEAEGRNELVKLLSQVEDGTATSDQVAQKIAVVTDGYGKSLSKIDGEAAYKFRATMATHGNAVLQQSYRTELQRKKQERIAKFDMNFDNLTKLLEAAAGEDPDNFDAHADVFRSSVLNESLLLGDAGIQREYSTKLDPAVKNAKVNAIVKSLLTDEALGDARGTLKRIDAGDLGKYGNMAMKLKATDLDTFKKIKTEFLAAVRQRKEGMDLAYVDSEFEGKDILRQIYSTTDAGQQRSLFNRLKGMPVDPATIRTARDFINSDSANGVQVDDLAAFGRISQRVALGLASQDEIIKAPLTKASKRQLMQAWANPNDDINFGVNQINMAVGIQSGNLPPEIKSAEARQLAVETRNQLAVELTQFARTPNDKGMLPTPSDIRAKSQELAGKASKGMAKAFEKVAISDQASASLFLTELQGVDLMDDAAVDAAIAKATKNKRNISNINGARDAIDSYRRNKLKVQESQQ